MAWLALRMRALASAILFFILNLIGLGLGPWSVGLLSDYLEPTHGLEVVTLCDVVLTSRSHDLVGHSFIPGFSYTRKRPGSSTQINWSYRMSSKDLYSPRYRNYALGVFVFRVCDQLC